MDNSSLKLQETLQEVFSPARPIDDARAFYGREEEVKRLSETIDEAGMHITLYGERGIGKTSLANVVLKEKHTVNSIKITCSAHIGFTNLWRDVIQVLSSDLPPSAFEKSGDSDKPSDQQTQLDTFRKNALQLLQDTEQRAVSLENLISLLQLIQKPLVIVLDEFDLAVKQETMSALFASTIKIFSDRLTHITLLFVGIANSGKELIGEHPSLERCLSQIMLKRMQKEEMKEFIEMSLKKVKLRIHPEVETLLLELAAGFPYFMHMLGKYAAESALNHRYTIITKVNLKESTQKAVRHMFENIVNTYTKATRPSPSFPKQAMYLYAAVLEAAARFKRKNYDLSFNRDLYKEESHETHFSLQDIFPSIEVKASAFGSEAEKYPKKVALVLTQLTQKSRGQILKKLPKTLRGEPNYYCFNNPLIKAYILLKLYLK